MARDVFLVRDTVSGAYLASAMGCVLDSLDNALAVKSEGSAKQLIAGIGEAVEHKGVWLLYGKSSTSPIPVFEIVPAELTLRPYTR